MQLYETLLIKRRGSHMQVNLQGNRFSAGHTNNVLKNIMTGQLQQNKQQEQNDNNKILAMLDVTSSMSCNMPKKDTLSPCFNKIRILQEGQLPDYPTAIDVKLGGAYEYTEEDAYNRLTAPSFKMEDSFLEQMGIDPSQCVADDTSIETGLSAYRDQYWADLDCGTAAQNTDQLEQSVDYLSSRYAVMKNRIEKGYSGEERTARLDELDQMMNKHKEKLAQNFADEVGTIFEENGVSGEKERLFQSVLTKINQQIETYTNFIKDNPDFANIKDADKTCLSKDSAYLANKLRKSVANTEPIRENDAASGLYTIDEMKKMQTFAKEFSSYTTSSFDLKGRTEKGVSLSDNE